MENKLTPQLGVTYSVSSMDEQVEAKAPGQNVSKLQEKIADQKKKQDEEEAKKRNISIEQARRERVEKEWKEVVQQKEKKGEKITDEEKEEIRKAIQKGESPINVSGGAIDTAFDEFDQEKYKDHQALYNLAKELKDLDKGSPNFKDEVERIRNSVHMLIGSLGVPEGIGNDFIEDVNKEIAKINKNEGGEDKKEEPEGDGNFQNFNMYLYRGTALEPLAQEVKNFGSAENINKVVDEQTFSNWVRRANQTLGQQGVNQELLDTFLNELRGNTRAHNEVAQRAGGQRAENQQGNRPGQQRRFDALGNEILDNTPRSIQEICKWIIKKEGDEWDVGGSSPLLDENENFNQANFVKWVRERMMHFHNLDPNNPSINLLGSVGIETEYKTVGLISMINNKKQYFKDEKKVDAEGRNVVYSDLVEDIVNEVYLFNTSRNHDASYRFAMWNDEELPKLLQQIHQKSDFTTGEQMKKIFSLSADYKEGGGRMKLPDGREIPDTRVGDTIRTIYEAYYYISDYEELQRVLGPDNPFFTRKGFEDAWRISSGKDANEPIPEKYAELFDTMFEGRDPGARPKPKEFLQFINLFNDTGKKQTEISLVREALRIAGSHVQGLENGLNSTGNKRKVERNNLEYAELWAYSMVRWTGAAARNDTGAIGYDAFTKSQRFQQYRIRQSSASRGAPIGNQYDLPVIKAWNLDLLNGIFVEKAVGEDKDFTPFEVLRMLDDLDAKRKRGEITQEEYDKRKQDDLDRLIFKQYTQLDYANNHLGKSFQMFHAMLGATELNLDQIVTHDRFRGLVFDRGKFEEQVKENFIKPIRYALSTYANIDYSKDMRVQVNPGQEPPIYETKTIAEHMFGPVVLQGYYKKEKGPDGKPVVDKEKLQKERGRLYKNVIRSIIASHLEAHRRHSSGYAFMNEAQITKFIEAIESIRAMEIEDVGEETQLSEGEHFFTHEDIAWIRKYSGTENWRLVLGDVILKEGGMGFLGGLFKGFKDIFDDIAKG